MEREVTYMNSIGIMTMPTDFRYRDVFERGKPQHDRLDMFRVRHPSMEPGRRAKIFSPFDALKGFSEAIASKGLQYRGRIELGEEDRRKIDRRLHILKGLTFNSRMARANRVQVTVTFYVPCVDENHEAYGLYGRYQTLTGICWNVDELYRTILIDRTRIEFDDILRIENSEGVFLKDWDTYCEV